MTARPRPLERISTGVRSLDEALRGGLPSYSTTVFAGASGTGKTVLALQASFHMAALGGRAMYFTTLSEPPAKLLRYMQLLEFFDPDLLADNLVLADLGSVLRSEGVEAALSALVDRVEHEEPDLVVVDSFKAVRDLVDPARGPAVERGVVYELAVSMAGWGATTILVGEYDRDELSRLPEFAIADGILYFGASLDELSLVRELEIRKLRGSDFDSGVHFYDLDASGLSFYPRLRGPQLRGELGTAGGEHVPTGVQGLDEMMGGGPPLGSSTVVLGSTGSGKTVLGLNFVLEGALRGDPSLLLMLEESPSQLRGIAGGLGWNLGELERAGLLELNYTQPVELSPDRFLHRALDAIRRLGARRVLLDSLTTLELGTTSTRRFKELVHSLIKHLRVAGVTLMMPMELRESSSLARPEGSGISFAADNLIHLTRYEENLVMRRSVAVLKERGVRHSEEFRDVSIGMGGMRVGPPSHDATEPRADR